MANFLLPQLNAEGPDYAGSFMRGMQLPYAIQGMQGRNEFMNAEMEKRKAIKAYAETGDINALKGAPETYIHMKGMERQEQQQDLGRDKLALEVGKISLPFLKANPTVAYWDDFRNTINRISPRAGQMLPALKTSEEITAYIEKAEQAFMNPKDRAALGRPAKPVIEKRFNLATGLDEYVEQTPEGGWKPFGGMKKETESEKGEFNRLIEFHQRIRGTEGTEESLKDLADKFNRRGLNLNNDVNFQATKQAAISLSRNVDFNTLDPSNPVDAAKREKMLIDETRRLKAGMTGQGGGKVTPPSYPATIQKADGVYTKTDQVDPRTGKPIYKGPNGELVLPK